MKSKSLPLVVALLVLGLLQACLRPPVVSGASVAAIAGQVDWGRTEFSAKASMSEIARAATVSLIDAQSSDTIATTLTNADGAFLLDSFPRSFVPDATKTYYLEAVKGLKVGGLANRAGAVAARVRTLVAFQGGQWASVTAGTLTISRSTTAITVVASLKGAGATPSQLIGKIAVGVPDTSVSPNTPDTFAPSGGLSKDEFKSVFWLVDTALRLDQDPFAVIVPGQVAGTYSRVTTAPAALAVSPATGSPGDTITLLGQNFDPTPGLNVVTLNGVQANVTGVSADRAQLTFQLPDTAYSGNLSVAVDNVTVTGPPFEVFRTLAETSPLASKLLYGLSPNAERGFSIFALQDATTVQISQIDVGGGVASTVTQTVNSNTPYAFTPGNAELMYRLTADKPITASWNSVEASHGSDDDIACQSGRTYYFRMPQGSGTFQVISHSNANPVTITGLNDPAKSASVTLGEGQVYTGSTSGSSLANTFFRVESAGTTTTIYGLGQDNDGTQVYSSDMKSYFAAHPTDGLRGFYVVGWEDGTTITVRDLDAAVDYPFALDRGAAPWTTLPAGGVRRLKATGNKPFGFYVHGVHALPGGYTGSTQHSSADIPGAAGRRYHIVGNDPGSAVTVYVLSLADSNQVTLSGGISGGPYSMGKDSWFNAGGLNPGQVLSIQAPSPVHVWTIGANRSEANYTLVPTN